MLATTGRIRRLPLSDTGQESRSAHVEEDGELGLALVRASADAVRASELPGCGELAGDGFLPGDGCLSRVHQARAPAAPTSAIAAMTATGRMFGPRPSKSRWLGVSSFGLTQEASHCRSRV